MSNGMAIGLGCVPLAFALSLVIRGFSASGDGIRDGFQRTKAILDQIPDQSSKLIVVPSEFGRPRSMSFSELIPFAMLAALVAMSRTEASLQAGVGIGLLFVVFFQRRRFIRYEISNGTFTRRNLLLFRTTRFELSRVRGYERVDAKGTAYLTLFADDGTSLVRMNLDSHELERLEAWAQENLAHISSFYAA
ncbi:MAG: hypothetical protein V4760_04915 [Bdellovibrionota bacterium]